MPKIKKSANKVPMYVIACDIFHDGAPMYLAWQPYAYANSLDDQYFWTSLESVFDILQHSPSYNMPPHQFAFGHKEGAESLMKRLGIAENIVRIDLDKVQKGSGERKVDCEFTVPGILSSVVATHREFNSRKI